MPVDSTVYAELTKPFRIADDSDSAVLAAYPFARAIEAISFFSEIAAVQVACDERFELLSAARRRFLLIVEGTDYIAPDDFAGQCPSAILKCARYGLAAGRRVLIVKFTVDYANNRTHLLVWG